MTASASIRDPQTFNRYSYVLNSPYKFTDPLGLLSVTTGACGQWCQGNDGGSTGGAFASAITGGFSLFNWETEVTGYGLDQPDGSTVINGEVLVAQQTQNEFPLITNAKDLNKVYEAIQDTQNAVNSGRGIIIRAKLIKDFRQKGDETKPEDITNNLRPEGRGANIFDGRKSARKIRDENGNIVTVKEFFMRNKSVDALVDGSNMFLGQNFFNDAREGRAITMIHESVVHRAFGRSDREYGNGDKIQGSKNINSKIRLYYRTIESNSIQVN